MGYINFIVKPMMEVMVNLIPEFKQYMHIIDENKVFWDQKVAEGEEEL